MCSRDLKRRGPLVMWEGVLRLGGFGVMGFYGVFERRCAGRSISCWIDHALKELTREVRECQFAR